MEAVSLLIAHRVAFLFFSGLVKSSRENILANIKFCPVLIGHLVLEPNLTFQIRFPALLMAGVRVGGNIFIWSFWKTKVSSQRKLQSYPVEEIVRKRQP